MSCVIIKLLVFFHYLSICIKIVIQIASNEIEAQSISKRVNDRRKKRTFIILGLFLVALCVSCGIYQNMKHQTDNTEKLKCGNKFSVSGNLLFNAQNFGIDGAMREDTRSS